MIDLHKASKMQTGQIKKNITQAAVKEPLFKTDLMYTAPARGHWTIAHTPMIVPESHMIYLCASACMRGVVLSALEYGGMDRFSMIMLYDHDLYEGKMEEVMIDGISEAIDALDKRPAQVMAFTSCIHHFLACDIRYVYQKLNERYKDIDFVKCYMIPTIKKGKITPEEWMQVSLYDALEKTDSLEERSVNIIGSNFPFDKENELYKILHNAGYIIRDLPTMTKYSQYKDMAKSRVNIYTLPVARFSAGKLNRRLGQQELYMPLTFNFRDIKSQLDKLPDALGDKNIDTSIALEYENRAYEELKMTKELIGDSIIAIDHEVMPRYLSLARMLIEFGYNVKDIYADIILPEEEEDLEFIKMHASDITIHATTNYACRMADRDLAEKSDKIVIAIGQKAAYFTGTSHFVNILDGGGYWGFYGAYKISQLIKEAYLNEKDVPKIISIKGFGCSGEGCRL